MYRTSEQSALVKIAKSNVMSSCADSVGSLILGLRCSWWHPRQANDIVASKRSIFSENHNDKFSPYHGEHVCTYISGSRCAWW